jgi:hypothetical protein
MEVRDDSEVTTTHAREELDGTAHPEERAARADLRHRNWLHTLFAVGDYEHVPAVAAVASGALFVALFVLSAALGLGREYLDPSTFLGSSAYLGCAGVFVVLVVLGRWTVDYADVWRTVEPCFAVDEQSYEAFLDDRLRRLFDVRPVVVLFVVFEPVFAFAVNDLNPLVRTNTTLFVINATLVFLGLTALYMLVVHFVTVDRAMRLEFDNVYTAARRLEPLVQFGVDTAFWWFVGLSLVATYYWLQLSDTLQQVVSLVGVEVASGPLLGAVGHAVLLGLLILFGLALVVVPTWRVHVALTAAKKDLLADVDSRYHEIVVGWTTNARGTDEVATALGVAEQAHASAERIRTWPYDVSGLLGLLVSSVVPLSQFVLTTLRDVFGVG